jgi:hypothetical protein
MDINIKRTPAEERSIFRMKKGLDIRKANIQILVLFALGFVPAIFNSDDLNSAISYSGLLFTGASFILYYQTHLKKRVRIKPIALPQKKDDAAENLVSLKLDDSFITTETFDRYFRIKWSLVTGYRLYKGCLLIRIGKKMYLHLW